MKTLKEVAKRVAWILILVIAIAFVKGVSRKVPPQKTPAEKEAERTRMIEKMMAESPEFQKRMR